MDKEDIDIELAVHTVEVSDINILSHFKTTTHVEINVSVEGLDFELWLGEGQSKQACKMVYGALSDYLEKLCLKKATLIEEGTWVENEFNEVFGKLFDYKAACFKYSE